MIHYDNNLLFSAKCPTKKGFAGTFVHWFNEAIKILGRFNSYVDHLIAYQSKGLIQRWIYLLNSWNKQNKQVYFWHTFCWKISCVVSILIQVHLWFIAQGWLNRFMKNSTAKLPIQTPEASYGKMQYAIYIVFFPNFRSKAMDLERV